jgi:hypothetical protein
MGRGRPDAGPLPFDLPAVSRFGLSARRGRREAGRGPTHRSYRSIALKHRLQATAFLFRINAAISGWQFCRAGQQDRTYGLGDDGARTTLQGAEIYQIAGSVDGLKVDPVTGQIWALQNQDGNSTLTIIDPETGSMSDPISYKVPSSSRGYDDVVFRDGKVFPIKRGVRAK